MALVVNTSNEDLRYLYQNLPVTDDGIVAKWCKWIGAVESQVITQDKEKFNAEWIVKIRYWE